MWFECGFYFKKTVINQENSIGNIQYDFCIYIMIGTVKKLLICIGNVLSYFNLCITALTVKWLSEPLQK